MANVLIRSKSALAVVVLAATITATGCGATPGRPTAAGPSISAATVGTGPAGSTDADQSTADGDTGGSVSVPLPEDSHRFATLDLSIRVANVWESQGTARGAAVDVWTGDGQFESKKLLTVPYGQISAFVSPLVWDPDGTAAGDPKTKFQISIYPAGATPDSGNQLGLADETPVTGEKLTFAIGPGDMPTDLGALQEFVDQLGPTTGHSAFDTPLPAVPAGHTELQLNALGLADAARSTPPSLTMSSANTCVPYIADPQSGKQRSQDNFVTQVTSGGSALTYVFPTGAAMSIDHVKTNENVAAACHDQPALTLNTGLTAGQGDRVFLYGPSLVGMKALVVSEP